MPASPQSVFRHVLGDGDSIHAVEARAKAAFKERRFIAWEGDPETFHFTYVSSGSQELLGYPASCWLHGQFWADTIIHPSDRAEAIAFCALATAKGKDHDFVYRAIKADGSTILLHDVVKVIFGVNGIPTRLQGLMFEIRDGDAVVPVFDKFNLQHTAA